MKDKELFIGCMKDMWKFLKDNNLGFPLELEVEHHIVNKFADNLMKAGNVFPLIRWCNAGNSQEKRAEHFNRRKKYGFEKRYNNGVGRFTLTEANRPKQDKTWDDDGMHLKEKIYTFEELVANDRFTIEKYNHSLHPNQKKYPGMTRMQVLLANVNPNVDHPRWSQATERRIGELSRRPSLLFNGYQNEVKDLYADMDLVNNF